MKELFLIIFADTCHYPESILKCLKSGAFTVSKTGEKWHAVALDEAHEMCFNKDLKAAIVHLTDFYLQNIIITIFQ